MEKTSQYKEISPLEFVGEISQNFAQEAIKVFLSIIDLLYIVYYCIAKIDKSFFFCFSPTINAVSAMLSIILLLIECVADCLFGLSSDYQTIASQTIRPKFVKKK